MALGTAWKQMSWLYYQYLLVTALYMLEPWERTVFNSMLVSIVGMALYTGYVSCLSTSWQYCTTLKLCSDEEGIFKM